MALSDKYLQCHRFVFSDSEAYSMAKYLIKRIASSILTFILVSFVVYLLIDTTSDPAKQVLGTDYTEEQYQAKLVEFGLDEPFLLRYVKWLGNFVTGDMGHSFTEKSEAGIVFDQVISGLKPTLALATISIIVVLAIALPLGIFAAKHRNGIGDGAVISISLLGISIPVFVLCALFLFIFAAKLKVLPVAGYKPPSEYGFAEFIKYMILPVLSLSILNVAYVTRMTRSAMLDVLGTDYIKTAKAKGLKPGPIFYKHALKNAFNIILTVIGQTYGSMLAGAAVVEMFYNIPGMGVLLIKYINKSDYNMILGFVMTICLIFIIINLVTDFLYGVFDPRVRITGKTSK